MSWSRKVSKEGVEVEKIAARKRQQLQVCPGRGTPLTLCYGSLGSEIEPVGYHFESFLLPALEKRTYHYSLVVLNQNGAQ